MRIQLAYGREKLWIEFPEGGTVDVGQALQAIKDVRPEIYERWCDQDGQLRRSLTIFVNGENIRYRQGLETGLSDGDEVYVIPLIAGG
ncbi:MAG: MoaD/ThiS family protein [Anaerolineae bacterium]|jgi:molybdopterin converting factor small subunit|nr:MoaD/ThiS family protein [Anaerolineae bacterium]MDH7474328.1 MoaD/ThiS family protein [Anaerolineae bacterium]